MLETKRSKDVSKQSTLNEAYDAASSLLKSFYDIKTLILEMDARVPEFEAVKTQLEMMDSIRSRQDSCIEILKQDATILQQVIHLHFPHW